jgi:predicted DNA-binding protein (UPF0251 family)
MNALNQGSGDGRVNQKARTRAALLASAVHLIRQGQRPTIEEAALAIGVSKRTAYRYFISQDHMLADAALDGLRDGIADMFASLSAGADAYARLDALALALAHLSEVHEAELRVMMRAALDRGARAPGSDAGPQAPARGGRRLEWIETALEPVSESLPPERYRALVEALAVCLGVDALLVLRDVCGLTASEAGDRMAWIARTLLDRALTEAGR